MDGLERLIPPPSRVRELLKAETAYATVVSNPLLEQIREVLPYDKLALWIKREQDSTAAGTGDQSVFNPCWIAEWSNANGLLYFKGAVYIPESDSLKLELL